MKTILAAISTSLLFGCSSIEEQSVQSANDTASGESNSNNIENMDGTIDVLDVGTSLSDAIAIFREAHPGAHVHSVNLDHGLADTYVYEVTGVDSTTEYEITINPSTKELVRENSEIENDVEDKIDFSSIIQPGNAIKVASKVKETKEMVPTSWSLKAENGEQTYVVIFENSSSEVKVKVDAVKAKALDIEAKNENELSQK